MTNVRPLKSRNELRNEVGDALADMARLRQTLLRRAARMTGRRWLRFTVAAEKLEKCSELLSEFLDEMDREEGGAF